jgi:hypothetical protein
MRIKLDEELVERDSPYTLESTYNALDHVFSSRGWTKEETTDDGIVYCGHDAKRDFGICGLILEELEKAEWFLPYCPEWTYLKYDVLNGIGYLTQENVLQSIKQFPKKYGLPVTHARLHGSI